MFIDFQRDRGLVMRSILGKWRDSSFILHSPVVHDGFSAFHFLSLLLAVVWKNIPWNWIFLSWDRSLGEELSSHQEWWGPRLSIQSLTGMSAVCAPLNRSVFKNWSQYLCLVSLWTELPKRHANFSSSWGQKGKFGCHP